MNDLELELRVGRPTGRELRIEVLGSPAGEASTTATFPYDQLTLDNRLKDLQLALISRSITRRRVVPEQEQAVMRFGHELFDAIFTGEVRSLLDRSREHATREGVGLRIQLRFESADMAALPWEFLYDSRCEEYLALSRSTPIVRYVEVPQPQRPLAVTRPLRVLAMVASPSDLATLDVAQERARIDTALGGLDGRVDLQWLEGQTWRHLQDALRDGTWHAFHFVGHGGFDAERGEGMIALADERGETHRLGATDLGILLGDHPSLRLAVLNSCDGARADRLDIFSSTAAVLVRRGTPAVVAMQYEISDAAAVELSRSFYSALAQGLPVDGAITEARKAVAMALPGTVEWGTPVLHLRAPDGRIFDLGPEPIVAAPPPPPMAPADDEAPRGEPNPRDGARRTRLAVVAGGVVVLVALVAGLLVALGGDDRQAEGMGRFMLEIGDDGRVATHGIHLPPDTVALVSASSSDAVDADLAVVTSRTTARSLARYFGFDPDIFNGALDHYRAVPDGRVVARADEGAVGAEERLAVLAPSGGSFEIVVGGADTTSGPVVIEVRSLDLDAPREGEDLVDRALDDDRIRSFLSEAARRDLTAVGAINVVPHEQNVPDLDVLVGKDLFGDLDPGTLECLESQLDTLFSDGGEGAFGPSEQSLQAVVERCGGDGAGTRSFGEIVGARLAADGATPPDVALSCPPEARFDPFSFWVCRAADESVTWVVVLEEGGWAYDHGPDLVRAVGDIAAPGALCRDVRANGYSYFYAVVHWLAEGRPPRLDADNDGIPCETQYPADEVARLWG